MRCGRLGVCWRFERIGVYLRRMARWSRITTDNCSQSLDTEALLVELLARQVTRNRGFESQSHILAVSILKALTAVSVQGGGVQR